MPTNSQKESAIVWRVPLKLIPSRRPGECSCGPCRAYNEGMQLASCAGCQALQRRLHDLQAENERLRRLLDEATRAGKRQAAPFTKGPPAGQPKKPGQDYGPKAHRQPPSPEQINEVHEAPLPHACPDCGGTLDETHIAQQFQVEIPRQPIHRQFNIHIGRCRQCRRRVQGRHPLQTSDALGAAAGTRPANHLTLPHQELAG
jgi:transposase